MKKFLLLTIMAFISLTGMAESKFYTDNLIVSIDGADADPIEATVEVQYLENGNINFLLKNFSLSADMHVGNIVVNNLKLTPSRRFSTFAFQDNITITAGDEEGVFEEEWIGPALGEIPLQLRGRLSDNKLYVTIDIPLVGMLVKVQFGTDFPELAIVKSQDYVDDLVVTINGESSDPQKTTITVEHLETGDINFLLKNFNLGGEINVGNISIKELQLAPGNSYSTFAYDADLEITAGDKEGVAQEEWMGPMLGLIPLKLTGKINDTKLYVTIDIDMMASLGQIVGVEFGADIEDGIAAVTGSHGENNEMYDLAGRRVERATKGIFIIGGKKVVR